MKYEILGKIDNMRTPWRIEMHKDHGSPLFRACSEFDYYGITVEFPLRREKKDIGYVWYICIDKKKLNKNNILPEYLQRQINKLLENAENNEQNIETEDKKAECA